MGIYGRGRDSAHDPTVKQRRQQRNSIVLYMCGHARAFPLSEIKMEQSLSDGFPRVTTDSDITL